MIAPISSIENITNPLGFLDAAFVSSQASVAMEALETDSTVNARSLEAFRHLLSMLLSTESLENVRPEYVDSFRLLAIDSAFAKIGQPEGDRATIQGLAAQLVTIDADIASLLDGKSIAADRISYIRKFSSSLADSLIDQVPWPTAPGDGRRV